MPTGAEPDESDAAGQARFWTDVNMARWAQALELENRTRVAICDSDPMKLHYSWCLARAGAAPASRFAHELAFVRDAMSQKQLGFADVVLATVPDEATLLQQKLGDSTRSRGSFKLNVKLREPLIEWYRCLSELRPGHVVWELPPAGVGAIRRPASGTSRYDVGTLDNLVGDLPRLQ